MPSDLEIRKVRFPRHSKFDGVCLDRVVSGCLRYRQMGRVCSFVLLFSWLRLRRRLETPRALLAGSRRCCEQQKQQQYQHQKHQHSSTSTSTSLRRFTAGGAPRSSDSLLQSLLPPASSSLLCICLSAI